MGRARFPKRCLVGETINHITPVEVATLFERFSKRGQSRGMIEHHGDACIFFSCCTKLWPVLGDRRMQCQLAFRDQDMCTERDSRLGHRVDHAQSIFLPVPILLRMLPATPEIDNSFTLNT